jgi:hypothetical protein
MALITPAPFRSRGEGEALSNGVHWLRGAVSPIEHKGTQFGDRDVSGRDFSNGSFGERDSADPATWPSARRWMNVVLLDESAMRNHCRAEQLQRYGCSWRAHRARKAAQRDEHRVGSAGRRDAARTRQVNSGYAVP